MSVCESEIDERIHMTIECPSQVTIGVLGLQGDFDAHIKMVEQIDGVTPRIIKQPRDLEECSGLILPGGESTTVGKLMERYGIDVAIRHRVSEGMAVFGTCTGMILLAKVIENSDQQRLGLMDITVRRNAFGRQVDSFETNIDIPEIGSDPINAVFIRAPFVTQVRGDARIIYKLDDERIIFVRQNKLLAAAFHPELTADTRVHQYFVNIARGIA
jgi:5'-phosphate synthase pdxT subunit